jgi:hypothetical protein
MMLIDMTAQLGSLMMAIDAVLVFAATAIAVSAWHAQSASLRSQSPARKLAVVGSSGVPATTGDAPSDTSVPEAA